MQIKIEGRRKEREEPRPRQETEKTREQESDADTNCNRCSHERIDKGTGKFGIKNMCEDHPNSSVIKIDQNIKKSPGDLKRFAVTQTPIEEHQLMLV